MLRQSSFRCRCPFGLVLLFAAGIAAAQAQDSGTIGLAVSGRTAFVRMETNGRTDWTISNRTDSPLTGASLLVDLDGFAGQRLLIPTVKPGAELELGFALDTNVRPGHYTMKGRIEGADGEVLSREESVPVTIVARPLPFRMPVILWGDPNIMDGTTLQTMKRLGFTHSMVRSYAHSSWLWDLWDVGESVGPEDAYRRKLDYALAHGHGAIDHLYHVDSIAGYKPEFQRVDRAGRARESRHNPCGLSPGVVDYAYDLGAAVARAYGDHPGLQAALLFSEHRDNAEVCFHEWDRAAFRAYAGFDILDEVTGKNGVHYTEIEDFPADRVIPDDYPLLTYYRWYWKQGDGWNGLISAVNRGLKSTGRTDLWTWFDPAVRTPMTFGSGGEADVISQWTYCYPDPIKIGLATDELFAMADGAKSPQKVMKATQIIWHRSLTAPKPGEGEADKSPRAAWMDTVPDADYITIPPDCLRLAFWAKMARPVQGIMYHGWGSLVDVGSTRGYCFSNPQTQEALAGLTRDVVRPLGPTLMQVPDRKSDVGYLESFASSMFAGRGNKGTWGYSNDDTYLTLLYAMLQPQVLYEESIIERGLDGFKVLVMSKCDVLPRGVVDQVKRFQQNGGIIVGDEVLVPAIVPDILLPYHRRTKKADVDKAAIQANAAALRKELATSHRQFSDSSNPDIITRVRSYRTTDYLFAVNDLREYGDYIGQWGLVMEKGVPAGGTLTLDRPSGFVYDLTTGESVSAVSSNGRLHVEHQFGPADGTVFMVTERAIAGVELTAPREAGLGQAVRIRIDVVGEEGKRIEAVVPVHVDILDAEGESAEFSGYYGARDGRVDITLDLAVNDKPGNWIIRARELASGRAADCAMNVAGP